MPEMKSIYILFLTAALLPCGALAQELRSSVDFTAGKIAAHRRHVATISRVARQHLEAIWSEHEAFYQRHPGLEILR